MTTKTIAKQAVPSTVDPELWPTIQEILRRPYRKVIRGTPEEGFLAEVPELPGCKTAGATEIEALQRLPEAMTGWIAAELEQGRAIPEPTPESAYSGRMLVRMPKWLHRRLTEQAEQEGVSLNQYIVSLLANMTR